MAQIAAQTIPQVLRQHNEQYPEQVAQLSKDKDGTFQPTTYHELYGLVKAMAFALADLGVVRGDHVGIMSDNRKEWYITDLALLAVGAVDVPRGSDSTEDEMGYILCHADCRVTFAENGKIVDKILSKKADCHLLTTIIVFDEDYAPPAGGSKDGVTFLKYDSLMKKGEALAAKGGSFFEDEIEKGHSDDLATIIYTSGTTGEPKGVMLPHRSYLFQVERATEHLHVSPGDIFLSVLPVWHSFERAVEYVILYRAATIAYSKPLGKIMLEDMEKTSPQWLASVPRIWEGVRAAVYRNISKESAVKKALFHFFVGVGETHAYLWTMFRGLLPQFHTRIVILDALIALIPLLLLTPFRLLGSLLVFKKIRAKLGGKFIAGISGGGALPPYVDRFFQAAGVLLLEGYGLTETGPILAVRREKRPVPNTVGPLFRDIEFKVVATDGKEVSFGNPGVLFIKSPQLMNGYYKKPDITAKVMKDGWLDTGDIVLATRKRDIKIIGRAKDTIVLLGGENVEPEPIESTIVQSEYIDQVMVVGQDQKFLGALIVPNPEMLNKVAAEKNIAYVSMEDLLPNPEVQEVFYEEIQRLVNTKTGFKAFEQIFRFLLMPKAFEVGEEMTATLKIKRNVVSERYRKEIASLFKSDRS